MRLAGARQAPARHAVRSLRLERRAASRTCAGGRLRGDASSTCCAGSTPHGSTRRSRSPNCRRTSAASVRSSVATHRLRASSRRRYWQPTSPTNPSQRRWPERRETRPPQFQGGWPSAFGPLRPFGIECWSEPRPARGRGRRATGCLRVPRRHPDGWRLLLYLRQPVARRPRPSASGACRYTCLRKRCRKGGRASGRAGVFCAGKGGGGGRRPAPGDTEQDTPARPDAPASNCQSGRPRTAAMGRERNFAGPSLTRCVSHE